MHAKDAKVAERKNKRGTTLRFFFSSTFIIHLTSRFKPSPRKK